MLMHFAIDLSLIFIDRKTIHSSFGIRKITHFRSMKYTSSKPDVFLAD